MSRQIPLDMRVLRPRYGRDRLIAGAANREALAYIDAWPDWSGHALALVGPAGSGKTHLARIWADRSGAEHVDATGLARLDIGALGPGCAILVERIDVLSLDEEALLHLFNWTREQGGSLLLTARTAPARLPLRLADLVSRLATVPTVAIGAPDDRMLRAVLAKQFADRQLRVSDAVVNFLLRRCERSFPAIERLADALDAAAMAEGRKIGIGLARTVMDRVDRGDE